MATYFISDLHLSESCKKSSKLFNKFIKLKAYSADAIFILGDFWDYWIGDDCENQFTKDIKSQLKELSKKVPLYFIPGNRDFLVGKKFSQDTNCKIIPDSTVINLYGKKILLAHGDSFCTDDKDYQKYKKVVRNPIVKFIYNLLPLKYRTKIANYIRDKSKANHNQNTGENNQSTLVNVNHKAIKDSFENNNVDIMIHGHTHIPNIHSVSIGRSKAKRVVLGDWGSSTYILKYTKSHSLILELFRL